MKLEFEWGDAKSDSNWKRHGASFELATTVFKDPFAIERIDDREDYGEERFVIVGMAEGRVLLCVAFSQREECIRIISARRATQNEQADYFEQDAWADVALRYRQSGASRSERTPAKRHRLKADATHTASEGHSPCVGINPGGIRYQVPNSPRYAA